MNGNSADVTTSGTSGSWVYNGATISVGDGPGTFHVIVQYYDAQGNAVPVSRGGYQDFQLNVFKVERFDDVNAYDYGNPSNTCYWSPPNGIVASAGVTRTIRTGFKVTGPSECGGDGSNITVGIIQTLTEYTALGSVSYRLATFSPTPLPPNPGTMAFVPNPPSQALPWWDGNQSRPPYYGQGAYVFPLGQGTNQTDGTWLWQGGLTLTDTPHQNFPDVAYGYNNYTYTYQWGNLFAGNTNRGGTPTHGYLEDRLAASSVSVGGIYVPVGGAYHAWEVDFEGYLDPFSVWYGGMSQIDSAVGGKPEVVYGPANERTGFTFP